MVSKYVPKYVWVSPDKYLFFDHVSKILVSFCKRISILEKKGTTTPGSLTLYLYQALAAKVLQFI